jgi:16S rRNA (cytidine1402-2'-O)-methyltransferase
MAPVSEPKKRQDLPKGTWPQGLWVVATPIGNLEDFTDRARQALRLAGQIVCEDTRRTAQLLSHSGIEFSPGHPRLVRLDAHATEVQLEKIIQYISEGNSVALVTDAGTPSVSDPGSALVSLAHKEGVRVTPIPGASALPAFLSVSGFMGTAFCFHGFFPRKQSERLRDLSLLEKNPCRIHIWFESPQRILEALECIVTFGAPDGPIGEFKVSVAKELTKLFERIWVGKPQDVLESVRSHLDDEGALGEWVFGIELEDQKIVKISDDSSDWVKTIECLLEAGIGPSEAAKRVSQHFGVAKNEVYKRALEISQKKSTKNE